MTPRQIYRELVKLTRQEDGRGRPILLSKRWGPDVRAEVVHALVNLLEKIDCERARYDLAQYYRAQGRERPRRGSRNIVVADEGRAVPRQGSPQAPETMLDALQREGGLNQAERPDNRGFVWSGGLLGENILGATTGPGFINPPTVSPNVREEEI